MKNTGLAAGVFIGIYTGIRLSTQPEQRIHFIEAISLSWF